MNRLLITGVDSVVGSNLALALSDRWEILGLYPNEPVESHDFSTAPCHDHESAYLRKLVGDLRPQWIIHCPATSIATWDECHADDNRDTSAADLLPTAELLAELAESLQARLTVLSTDAVFSGPRMFHQESSPATGTCAHAHAARRLESYLETSRALVVRTHAYGWSPVDSHACFAEKAWQALASSLPFAADGCRYATPILASDLAELLARAYELKLEGLYHISGAERTSPHRFVRELAFAGGFQKHVGTHGKAGVPSQWDGRECETSMNSRRARRALETPMPLLREGLNRFAQQAENGWRDRLRALSSQPGRLQRAA